MSKKPIKRKSRAEAKKKEFYVNNKELLCEILKSKEVGTLTKEAVTMFSKMTNEIVNTQFSFKYPEEKEDISQSAMMDCIAYWKGFNPEKSTNAFSYFTQIIKNGCAKGFNKLHPPHYKDSKMISISRDQGLYNF